MDYNYNVGDRIVCVNLVHMPDNGLSLNSVYKIVKIDTSKLFGIFIVNDNSRLKGYIITSFIKLNEYRNQVINNILG